MVFPIVLIVTLVAHVVVIIVHSSSPANLKVQIHSMYKHFIVHSYKTHFDRELYWMQEWDCNPFSNNISTWIHLLRSRFIHSEMFCMRCNFDVIATFRCYQVLHFCCCCCCFCCYYPSWWLFGIVDKLRSLQNWNRILSIHHHHHHLTYDGIAVSLIATFLLLFIFDCCVSSQILN